MHRVKKLSVRFFLFFFISQSLWALSPEAERIFSRQYRVYAPPPRSVRASRGIDSKLYAANDRATKKKYEDIEISAQAKGVQDSSDEPLEEQAVEEPLAKKERVKKKSKDGDTQVEESAELKKRRFGVGVVGGGAYGIFGLEFDFRLHEQWTAGFGFGTGMTYDTWAAHSRFFFSEDTAFSPFTQMGYANWYTRRTSQTGDKVKPQFLTERFFDGSNGNVPPNKRVHLLYGGIGVLYQSHNDVAVAAQLDYFIHLKNFEGGLYGSVGLYYYF